MKIKIRTSSNQGIIELNDKMYLSSGAEGSIYVSNNQAYKIYHDNKKVIPHQKIKELFLINNSNVITPKDIIYDIINGNVLGYVTTFISNSDPILKYFTKTFKNDNNVSYSMILELIKRMQTITTDVHKNKCLIVDYNELNILVKEENKELQPYYIDCDSYQTPSYKSTAVMKSIMDRRVANNINGHLSYNPDELSDWFSWGILSFYILTNIHPFRSNHPLYKPNQKEKQMDDNISVFSPGSKVPPSTNSFNIIPKHLLDWYRFIFSDTKNRSIPPLPDSSVPLLVPTQIITIQGTDKISIADIASYADPIITIQTIMGVYYVATKKHFYANQKEIGTHNAKKVNIAFASDGTIIVATQDNSNKILFKDLTKSDPIGTATSDEMFSRNNAIYTIARGKLIENIFRAFGNKIIHQINEIENVSITSAKMYDGCVIQDLLGKIHLTLPYKQGSCFSKHISILDGYRIIAAKAEKNVIVVVGEKKGQYDRFILVYNKTYASCDIRKVDDIAYDTINFTVMDNGLCILLSSPTEIELFTTATQCETLSNPPFDSTMKLFSTSDGIFFINGNSFHQVKRK